MDQVERKNVLMKCKKCDSPLDIENQLDLMTPPVYDNGFCDLSDIIIPVSGSDRPYEVIEIPPERDDYENSLRGISSTLAEKIKIANEVFNYMSGNSVIDHPMCQDCANIVIRQQEALLKQAEEDYNTLENYLKEIGTEKSNEKEQNEEIEKLENEELSLQKEIKELQEKNEKLDEEITVEESKLKDAETSYDKIVMEYNNKKQELWNLEDDIKSLNQRKRYLSFLADRLKRTNLLDILFPIWFEDNFGTINGLRMGRLPELSIEWAEINAAWGQCVLLLQNILRKLEMTLEGYRLVPCGSSSYIESLKDKKKYNLFQLPGLRLTNKSLDQAMVVYLECLSQVTTRIETYDETFKFPYQIVDKTKLTDVAGNSYSIKLNNNSDENWTKALKYMLIDLKWIKAWLVKASFKEYCDSLKTNVKIVKL